MKMKMKMYDEIKNNKKMVKLTSVNTYIIYKKCEFLYTQIILKSKFVKNDHSTKDFKRSDL